MARLGIHVFQNLSSTSSRSSGRLILEAVFPNHWMDEWSCQIHDGWNSQPKRVGMMYFIVGCMFLQRERRFLFGQIPYPIVMV